MYGACFSVAYGRFEVKVAAVIEERSAVCVRNRVNLFGRGTLGIFIFVIEHACGLEGHDQICAVRGHFFHH